MDTTINKQAAVSNKVIQKLITSLLLAGKEIPLGVLTLASGAGLVTGGLVGTATSAIKSNNSKITALNRKKKFYDNKIDEMSNENWLNDIITLRKKLETARIPDDERTSLEQQYKNLLDK